VCRGAGSPARRRVRSRSRSARNPVRHRPEQGPRWVCRRRRWEAACTAMSDLAAALAVVRPGRFQRSPRPSELGEHLGPRPRAVGPPHSCLPTRVTKTHPSGTELIRACIDLPRRRSTPSPRSAPRCRGPRRRRASRWTVHRDAGHVHDASVHDRNLIIPIVLGVIFLVLTLLSARQRPTLANLTRRVPRPAAPVISRHQRAGTDREADPGRRPRLTRRTSGGDPHGVAARPKAPAS